MGNDKKKFYEKLMEDSLKDVNMRRSTRASRGRKSNRVSKNNRARAVTKNGMVRFDNNDNQIKSKFLIQCVICILIIGIFYYLSNSNLSVADKVIEKTKIMLNSDLKINDKINSVFLKFNTNTKSGKKDGVSIDNNIIEEMEKEIEHSKKK